MEAYKKQILRYLSRRDYRPVKLRRLADELNIEDGKYEQFRSAFNELHHNGQVVVGSKGVVNLPPMANRIIGTYTANPRGFGFVAPVKPNQYGDLYISRGSSGGAMTGDTVVAKVMKSSRGGGGKSRGSVVDIVERGQSSIVGTLKKYYEDWVVEPDGNDFIEPVEIMDVSASDAKADDKVVVDIVDYPTEELGARGVISRVLGKSGMYEAEIESIIEQYELPGEFPEDCIEQAKKAASEFSAEDYPERDDISDEVLVTIDPPDAKDFDDAISLKKTSGGSWILGVHIADVSAFVGQNSPLDKEAYSRGNSVYLPGRVIPMLPKVLSNGICSLAPEVKRLAKSVYITYDRSGNVLGTEFANSVISSCKRLTYEQADLILKGKAEGVAGEVVCLLKDMETLARAIESRREKNGMLHLDLPETELVMNDEGKVVDAHPADDSYPHTIIEMFMVEANEAVASLLDRYNVPFMRRIHPDPDASSSKKVSRFVNICGIKFPAVPDRFAIQDLLKMVKGKSYEYAINMQILRSLQRAEYSPGHIGHFALASKHYCHFTSPIRRYADLLVHRLIDCYVNQRLSKIGLEEVLPEKVLNEIGGHITYTEQQAAGAESELKTVLVLQMLSEHIGDHLDVVVSGLTNFGVFAQCKKYGIEGLIEFGDLGMDNWRFDERVQAVVGKHSGKKVKMGEEMKVRIAAVNVPGRHLYLSPVNKLVEKHVSPGGGRRKKRKKSRRR